MLFQRVLEMDSGGRTLMVSEDGGRVVKAHPEFSIVMTSNTKGRGDMTGRFAGTDVQNSALLDRVDAVFEFEYPQLKKVYGAVAGREFLRRMQKSFDDIQAAISQGKINVDFSLRKMNALIWACRAGVTFWEALEWTCLCHFDGPEQEAIRDLLSKQFPRDYRYE